MNTGLKISRKGLIKMERKKELKQAYKEVKIESGIYTITNKQNGKKFVASTRNFKTLNGTKFTLENGMHTNKELQEEWNQYGKEAFGLDKKDFKFSTLPGVASYRTIEGKTLSYYIQDELKTKEIIEELYRVSKKVPME